MKQDIRSLRLKNGRRIKLRVSKHAQRYIVPEVIDNDCYFPTINGHAFGLKTDDIVIDIGANVGVFTAYAAKLVPKGHVYAFEPVRANFRNLKFNISVNHLSNVTIERIGISDGQRRQRIHLEHINAGHSLHKGKYMNPETIRGSELVELNTLQWVFEKYNILRCNFLKIDVEGDEWNILRALPAEFFNRIDTIALETHPNIDQVRLARLIRSRGFKVTIHDLDEILGFIYARR